MSEPVLLLRLIRYVDSEKVEHWIEVADELATIIEATDPPLKERLLKPAALERVADRRRQGNPWDGPRYLFTLFVGENDTWPGPRARDLKWEERDHRRDAERGPPPDPPMCEFCRGAELPEYAACLRCDRTGRDNYMPPITKADRERLAATRAYKPDKYKGGKGK